MTEADKLRFTRKVQKGIGCWLWTASIVGNGYGGFCLSGRMERAHRVAWQLAYGEIPTGLHVLHHCDVPNCVNPEHLFLGTHADNMRDGAAKGRIGVKKGRRWSPDKLPTHCSNGHEFNEANSYFYRPPSLNGRGFRMCRLCRKVRNAKRKRNNSRI